jgi:spore coat protein U domain-containing protein, fimbrial subunit CupE1/2/3/6
MKLLRMLAAFLVLLAAPSANANCSIATSGMSFGSYVEYYNAPTQGYGTVTISCDLLGVLNNNLTNSGNVIISLTSGNSSNFNRYMTNSRGDKLNYNIYTNPNSTEVFGDGTFGTRSISYRFNRAGTKNFTIYGSIPAKQRVKAGDYKDLMTITLLP